MTSIKKHKFFSIITGVIGISLGLILNQSILAHYLAVDGVISSKAINYSILIIQFSLITIGLYLLIKRPQAVGNYVAKYGSSLLLSLISVALTLLVSEFVLREIYPPKRANGAEILIPHPTLGWSKKPGSSYINHLPEDKTQVQVSYNSKGWRDVEHRLEKPDHVFRILVLGENIMKS